MTSVTSGCADWQQRPSNTLLKTECITEHLTTIDYGKQIDYTHVGGETEILSSLLIGHVRWFVLEGQQEGNDTTLFTIVCGLHETEYGYTSVKEMESVKVDGSKYGVDEIFQVEQLDGFKPVKLKSIPDEDLQTFLNRMEKK